MIAAPSTAPTTSDIEQAILDVLKPTWRIGYHPDLGTLACWHAEEPRPADHLILWPTAEPGAPPAVVEIPMSPGIPFTEGEPNQAEIQAFTDAHGAWTGVASLVDIDSDADAPSVHFLPKT